MSEFNKMYHYKKAWAELMVLANFLHTAACYDKRHGCLAKGEENECSILKEDLSTYTKSALCKFLRCEHLTVQETLEV